MTIKDFRIRAYSAPRTTPIRNGTVTFNTADMVICEVRTDSGATGVGWTHGGAIVFTAMREIAQLVIGMDEFHVERIWQRMYQPKLFGRKGLATRAISAIDIALWDCIGKQTGQSVHRLLGGYAESVPAYMAGGYYSAGKTIENLQAEMATRVRSGVRAVKMKIGGAEPMEDLLRIDAVREAVGPSVDILVDANNAYTRLEASRMMRALDERDIYWFEEPLGVDDLEGTAALAREGACPIALGENEYTKFGFKATLDARAANILNADAQILGGITEWRKCAALAEAHHIPVAPHGDQEIHVHLVSAVPNGLIAEYYDNTVHVLKDQMFQQRLEPDANGRLTPPDRPGLGFDINFAAIARYLVSEV